MDAGTRQAVERAIEFVRSNPNEPRAWMQLGHVYLAHQLAPQAAECMDHLAASNPSAQVHTMHAIALDQLGDTDARRTAIDAAIATDGKHTIPLWRGALWALETGDLNRAADLAQKAAETPKGWIYRYHRVGHRSPDTRAIARSRRPDDATGRPTKYRQTRALGARTSTPSE